MINRHLIFAAMVLLAAGSFTPATLAQGGGDHSDATITRGVEDALLANPALRTMDIRVGTREREVWLTGFVDSMPDIVRAGAVARKVNGVGAVHNRLRIADRPSRA